MSCLVWLLVCHNSECKKWGRLQNKAQLHCLNPFVLSDVYFCDSGLLPPESDLRWPRLWSGSKASAETPWPQSPHPVEPKVFPVQPRAVAPLGCILGFSLRSPPRGTWQEHLSREGSTSADPSRCGGEARPLWEHPISYDLRLSVAVSITLGNIA